MIICKLWIVALLCLGRAGAGVYSSNVAELAETACKTKTGTKHQFNGFAELVELAEHMSGLQVGHKLYECRVKHLEAIQEMVHVAESNNDDICGEQKIASIENYHRRFVTKVSKSFRLKRKASKAPKMVKLFFMQYVAEISSICEQAAIKFINSNGLHSLSAEQLTKMEKLRKFTDALGMSDLSKGYRGIYLFWNMIDSLSVAHNDKLAKYLSDGEVRTNVQMHDARRLNGLQAVCRYQLKPIYSRSLLPVLRLVDMGYYPRDHKLAHALLNDPNVRGLFYATQICETVLPIGIYSDEHLAKDQIVALTKEEASQLKLPEIKGRDVLAQNQPDVNVTPSSLLVDQLTFDESAVKAIKKNVESRGKVVNHLLKHMARQMRMKFRAAFDKFKLFRRDQNKQLEPIQEDLDSLEKLEITDDNESLRRRRGAWEVVKTIAKGVYTVIYVPLCVIKLLIFAIPLALLAWPAYKENEKALNAIDWMLHFGDPWWWGDEDADDGGDDYIGGGSYSGGSDSTSVNYSAGAAYASGVI